jgi:hypothetical protein
MRTWAAIFLLMAIFVPAPADRVASAEPVTSSACSHAVCLSVGLLAHAYVRDALVMAAMTLYNGNRSPVAVVQHGAFQEPIAQDLTESGGVAYPPPFSPPAVNGGWKQAAQLPIQHGVRVSQQQYLVLKGDRVRAVVHFYIVGAEASTVTLRTPSIRLSLETGPHPGLSVHAEPPVSAVVSSHWGSSQGPLYHVGWYACRLGNGTVQYGGSGFYEGLAPSPDLPNYLVGYLYGWTPTWSTVLKPGCSNPLEWHVVAGWLNRPVVTINYTHR